MRVFAYVGTRRGHKSSTRLLMDMFVSRLRDACDGPVIVSHHSPDELGLLNCTGCEKCFRRGRCPLDRRDSFARVKEEILLADLVILGSPVYAGMVSADMKLFIDRLAYWLHLMPLAGKYGVPIVTASTNHAIETVRYLETVMEWLGLCIPCTIPCTVDIPAMLSSERFVQHSLAEYAKTVCDYYVTGRLAASVAQERHFSGLARMYRRIPSEESVEAKFWRERGYLDYPSYQALQYGVSVRDSRAVDGREGPRSSGPNGRRMGLSS